MHRDDHALLRRIERFVRDQVSDAVIHRRVPLTIEAWDVGPEPVSFEIAAAAEYRPFDAGEPWGAPWGTTWFRLRGAVPTDFARESGRRDIELSIDLGFTSLRPGFQCEGAVYLPDGRMLKGLHPRNTWVRWPLEHGAEVEVLVEAASNPDVAGDYDFRPTLLGSLETAGDAPLYVFREASVIERDLEAYALERDLWTLVGLARELPDDVPRRQIILTGIERMMDAFAPDSVDPFVAARTALAPLLASPAWTSSHHTHAVGHAHIDSAWLWPIRETRRKVARTVANVLDLMDTHPDLVFAFSQAQQLDWLKQDHPVLFERVRARVTEGRFVPVGGMWVESDTNMPSGESLVRQFLEGANFFSEEFGMRAEEVWLPDSFGYSAALPQIARGVGARWFLTQKISWNRTNRMPHHTFMWEGIDGSRVFTHFPPVDVYHSELSAAELAHTERNFSEHGHATRSLVPFGWGDGGGGPTREMLEAAHRLADLEGSPTVELSTPRAFFEAAEAEYIDPPIWSGELYLELHRGVFTSQARTKRGNRRVEALLREAELWAATAAVRTGHPYPHDRLRAAWRTTLLNQFHDILPGSSIAWVHRQAEQEYEEIALELEELIRESLRAIAGDGDAVLRVNAAPHAIDDVPAFGGTSDTGMRIGGVSRVEVTRTVDGGVVIHRAADEIIVDTEGRLESWRIAGRELVPAGAHLGELAVHRDLPIEWDAWDIEDYARRTRVVADSAESLEVEQTETGIEVRVIAPLGTGSRVRRTLEFADGGDTVRLRLEIDWHERDKLLKLELPVAVVADTVRSEIQFGHVRRSVHRNTSWDEARFETVAHRWLHVGEPDVGLAIANDGVYGHDVMRGLDTAGETMTTVRLSLLRAPRFPDPDSDQGVHAITIDLHPTTSIADAVVQGYRTAHPVRSVLAAATHRLDPLVTSSHPGIVIETVKLADDRTGDVVVRVYEALGRRSEGYLRFGFSTADVQLTDLLERPLGTAPDLEGDAVRLQLRPFRIATLRVTPAQGRL